MGAAVIVFACGKIGFDFAGKLKRRVAEIHACESALIALESEMSFNAAPLAQAFRSIGRTMKTRVADIFIVAGRNIEEKSGTTAQEAWNAAIGAMAKYLSMKETDIGILKTLGETLGASDMDNQKSAILLAKVKLSAAAKEAEEEEKRYGRMYKNIGLLAGALIAILLV
jgi:stage III sporulation protein AB